MYILVNNKKRCPLEEISAENLMKYRLSKKAGMLVKMGDKLLLAKLPTSHDLPVEVYGTSLCQSCDCICKYCPKTTDLTLSIQLHIGRTFKDAVIVSSRSEKYDFITYAVELFNCKANHLIVLNCSNYRIQNPEDYQPQFFAETIWQQKETSNLNLKITGFLYFLHIFSTILFTSVFISFSNSWVLPCVIKQSS